MISLDRAEISINGPAIELDEGERKRGGVSLFVLPPDLKRISGGQLLGGGVDGERRGDLARRAGGESEKSEDAE